MSICPIKSALLCSGKEDRWSKQVYSQVWAQWPWAGSGSTARGRFEPSQKCPSTLQIPKSFFLLSLCSRYPVKMFPFSLLINDFFFLPASNELLTTGQPEATRSGEAASKMDLKRTNRPCCPTGVQSTGWKVTGALEGGWLDWGPARTRRPPFPTVISLRGRCCPMEAARAGGGSTVSVVREPEGPRRKAGQGRQAHPTGRGHERWM